MSRFNRFKATRSARLMQAAALTTFACAGAAHATIQELYSFGSSNGASPLAAPIQAADGSFFGTASSGGAFGLGAVYHLSAGGALTNLVSFNGTNGAEPASPLVLGSDGYYYGTTYIGGANNLGTVFKISTSGQLTTLYSFSSADGANPTAGVTFGSDGNLYGVTEYGGANNLGALYRISTSGSFTLLASFDGTTTGSIPDHSLTLAKDGNLYGTASTGGANGFGTIFKATTSGTITTLYAFDDRNGAHPEGQLTLGQDGKLYGTASVNGAVGNKYGVAFSITTSGKYSVLTRFNGKAGGTGITPGGALVQGSDGTLYGVTHGRTTDATGKTAAGTLFAMTTRGSLTTLAYLYATNGHPEEGVILGKDGMLYGVTSLTLSNLYGSVYRSDTAGNVSVFASFSPDISTGAYPFATVTEGADGNLYGTTTFGGDTTVTSDGNGTIFKMTPSGVFTSLVDFNITDGAFPYSTLTPAADGGFYGTTDGGGTPGFGTVFHVTTGGSLTTLVNFDNTNGAHPDASLSYGADGNLYSTTCGDSVSTFGTVFKMSTAGALTTLATLDSTTGTCPEATVTLAADGMFYGTTTLGGANNLGTIFKMTPNGTISVVAPFDAAVLGDGAYANLTNGTDGALYGINNVDGALGYGTVYRVGLDGSTSVLASFDGLSMGGNPSGALVPDGKGGFYGATDSGGTSNYGTVFYISQNGTFLVLDSFTQDYAAGLTLTKNGTVYGTSTFGVSLSSYGSVFKWVP